MKIDPRIQFQDTAQAERVQNAGNGAAQGKVSAANTGVSSASGEDTVKLSSAHSQAQALAGQLQAVPEVRVQRVSALQQQVRGGSYKPDNQRVADALIADHAKQVVHA